MELQNQSQELQQPQRSIEVVEMEINTLVQQAQVMILNYAIEVGRRLTEAKSLLPHGEWGKWLEEKVNFSHSKANDLMKIFEEYGADQIGLFGAFAKSQTVGNLPYTKALALLKIPSEEREEFIEKNDIENKSVRELKDLIKERDQAVAEKQEAIERADQVLKTSDELRAELEEARASAKTNAELAERAAEREADLRKELEEAKAAAPETAEPGEIPEDVRKKILAEGKKEGVEAERKKAEKQAAKAAEDLKAATLARQEAEAVAEEARKKVAELEKRVLLSGENVTLFKVHFEALQKELKACKDLIAAIGEQDPAMAEKFAGGLKLVAKELEG